MGNPVINLSFGDGSKAPIKMVMAWGWFMAVALPHYSLSNVGKAKINHPNFWWFIQPNKNGKIRDGLLIGFVFVGTFYSFCPLLDWRKPLFADVRRIFHGFSQNPRDLRWFPMVLRHGSSIPWPTSTKNVVPSAGEVSQPEPCESLSSLAAWPGERNLWDGWLGEDVGRTMVDIN